MNQKTVLATLLNKEVVYVKSISRGSLNTYQIFGKLYIPHFTVDPQQALDCGDEEKAYEVAMMMIDYQGRFYKPHITEF